LPPRHPPRSATAVFRREKCGDPAQAEGRALTTPD
jgi:hypothetical protein